MHRWGGEAHPATFSEREAGGPHVTGASQLKEPTHEGTAVDTALSTVQRLLEATTPPCCPSPG